MRDMNLWLVRAAAVLALGGCGTGPTVLHAGAPAASDGTSSTVMMGSNWELDPSNSAPATSSAQAIQTAEQFPTTPPSSERPTAPTAVYGLFTDKQKMNATGGLEFDHRLAWVVTFDGVRVTPFGPPGADLSRVKGQTCPFRVVVDGSNDAVLASFQTCERTKTASPSPNAS